MEFFEYNPEEMNILYNLGFDPSHPAEYYIDGIKYANALQFATTYPYTGLIEEFLQKGVNPNDTPLLDNVELYNMSPRDYRYLNMSPLDLLLSSDADENELIRLIELLLRYGARKETYQYIVEENLSEYNSDYMENFKQTVAIKERN